MYRLGNSGSVAALPIPLSRSPARGSHQSREQVGVRIERQPGGDRVVLPREQIVADQRRVVGEQPHRREPPADILPGKQEQRGLARRPEAPGIDDPAEFGEGAVDILVPHQQRIERLRLEAGQQREDQHQPRLLVERGVAAHRGISVVAPGQRWRGRRGHLVHWLAEIGLQPSFERGAEPRDLGVERGGEAGRSGHGGRYGSGGAERQAGMGESEMRSVSKAGKTLGNQR